MDFDNISSIIIINYYMKINAHWSRVPLFYSFKPISLDGVVFFGPAQIYCQRSNLNMNVTRNLLDNIYYTTGTQRLCRGMQLVDTYSKFQVV